MCIRDRTKVTYCERQSQLKPIISRVGNHTSRYISHMYDQFLMSNNSRKFVEWNTMEHSEHTLNVKENSKLSQPQPKNVHLAKKHLASSKKTLLSCLNLYKEYVYLKNFIINQNTTGSL